MASSLALLEFLGVYSVFVGRFQGAKLQLV